MPKGVYPRTDAHRALMRKVALQRDPAINAKIAATVRAQAKRGALPAHFTDETWRAIQEKGWEANRARHGEDVPGWKGENVGYISLLQWVAYHKGKAFGCECCGTQEDRLYNWTSRSGKRLRDLDDWMSICIPCRRKQSKLVPWNKGKKTGPNLKARGPRTGFHGNASSFQPGQTAHNKGKKMPSYSGEKHPAWKGGTTKLSHKIRTSLAYKVWRRAVLGRDNHTCVLCGYVSCKPKDMRADHIKPFHLYPALRFEVANGRALCIPCDHQYGWQVWRDGHPGPRKT